MEGDGAEWTLVHSTDCTTAAAVPPITAAATAQLPDLARSAQLLHAAEGGQRSTCEEPSEEEPSLADQPLQGPDQPPEQQQQQQGEILADSTADPAAAESTPQEEQSPVTAAPPPAVTYVAATSPWLSWMACLLGSAGLQIPADMHQADGTSWLASAGEAMGSIVEEVREEWTELAALIGHAVSAGQGAAAQQAKALRVQMSKAMHGNSWVLLSLGAVTAVAVVAMGSLVLANHKLAVQLKQRDKELARLLLRTMRLQETMQSSRAAVPILRLTTLQPAFAISSLA